jgi:hypothetical protein
LFSFIDWVLQLNPEAEDLLGEEVETLEEVKETPYITSVERKVSLLSFPAKAHFLKNVILLP